ncbi:MAG: GNAT family N-acetyltransferase [Betaproteobacteria bacterium]
MPRSTLGSTPAIAYRDLTTLDDFGRVVELERVVWGPGYDDVVPVPILVVTVHRGGILIGAFAGDELIGFVYSLPGIRDRRPTQWSHMTGVVDRFRNAGVGFELKRRQRERAMAMGLDLIEWTYDPLQAMNAHFNFAKLGVVVGEYEENVYGASDSPLHKGNPTDRFVAEWRIRDDRVKRRLAGEAPLASVLTIEPVNRVREAGEWLEPGETRRDLDARRVAVTIPVGFTDMLPRAPDLALAWRHATRDIFTTYFSRGYRAVEFFLDRPNRRGSYLLVL